MFVRYSQNVCRIFAAYLICCLESCSPHICRLLTQSIRRRPNLNVKSEHRRIIAEYLLAIRENSLRQCIFFRKGYLKATTPSNIISGFKKTGIYPCSNEAFNKEKLFPSECFRDEEPLKKVQAIKSSKEAIMAYMQEKMDKKKHH